jgi:hypothetical protein
MHDVYLISGFREPLPSRRRFNVPRIRWKAPTWHNHCSILVNSHVFHITSRMASDKIGYFASRGDRLLRLELRVDDISSPRSKLYGKRPRAEYCGRTHYGIEHIKFYSYCLIDQWRTYSISRSNCLMWAFALAAYIVERASTSMKELWANPQRLATLQELQSIEARRDGGEWEGEPPGKKLRILTFNLREKVFRIGLLADALQPQARLRLDPAEGCPAFISRDTEEPEVLSSYLQYLWPEDRMWSGMIVSNKLSRLCKRVSKVWQRT